MSHVTKVVFEEGVTLPKLHVTDQGDPFFLFTYYVEEGIQSLRSILWVDMAFLESRHQDGMTVLLTTSQETKKGQNFFLSTIKAEAGVTHKLVIRRKGAPLLLHMID